MVIKNFLNKLAELIFPKFCEECGKEGEWLCNSCLSRQEVRLKCCLLKGPEIYLDGLLAFFDYEDDSVLGRLIKKFKYSFITDIADLWSKIIKDNLVGLESYKDFVVLPVPLHSRRIRERGYNQANILVKIIIDNLHNPDTLNGRLMRIRYTKQQATLGRNDRLANLQGAFAWKGEAVPEKILLVDDVYTTGATLNECAKILKNIGAKQVVGLVLAKG